MRPTSNQQELDNMRRDPRNYKWGIFYFNRRDPRFILPKREPSLGFTVNFAHPLAYLVLLSILIFAVCMGNIGKILN
jgi:uncharacterized membrane protein